MFQDLAIFGHVSVSVEKPTQCVNTYKYRRHCVMVSQLHRAFTAAQINTWGGWRLTGVYFDILIFSQRRRQAKSLGFLSRKDKGN